MNVQATIIEEVRAALRGGAARSTADLVPLCGTADDTKGLSRILYVMRHNGLIAEDPVPGPPGRDGKPAKRWRWVGAESIEDASNAPAQTPPPARSIPMEEIAEAIANRDPTELALSDLVDQADEALLALADSLLAGNPLWSRLRTLADDTHGALCDYRLLRKLETGHE